VTKRWITCFHLVAQADIARAQDPDKSPSASLIKRIRTMLTKLDGQLEAYDTRVGSSLQLISCDARGRIPVADLHTALGVIKHAPDAGAAAQLTAKLDVDGDGFVELEHVLGLVRAEGLGVLRDDPIGDEVRNLVGEGREMARTPRKEDIVSDQ
jgi:LETM1 and EF-hand domain-containing protein 1